MVKVQVNPISGWNQADAECGRRAGAEWGMHNLGSELLPRLVWDHYRGPGQYEPPKVGPLGTAFYLYVAMYGEPLCISDGTPGGSVVDYFPSPWQFWGEVLGEDRGVELANRPGFAEGFIAGALGWWEQNYDPETIAASLCNSPGRWPPSSWRGHWRHGTKSGIRRRDDGTPAKGSPRPRSPMGKS